MNPSIVFKAVALDDERAVIGYYVRTGLINHRHYIALAGKEDLVLVEIKPETLVAFTGKFSIKSTDNKLLNIMFQNNTICAVSNNEIKKLGDYNDNNQ